MTTRTTTARKRAPSPADDLAGMHVEVRPITPDEAQAILDRANIDNRRLSRPRVLAYARDMKQGLWRITHQGLAFETDGSLVDGQHRLAAIVEAGIPIEFLVTTGVQRTDVFDTGRPRSAGDVLHIKGYRDTMKLAATAKYLIEYGRDERRPWERVTRIVSHAEISDYVAMHENRLMEGLHDAQKIVARIGSGASSSQLASGLVIVRNWADSCDIRQKVETDFLDGFVHGTGLQAGDPRLSFARWINGMSSRILSYANRREIIPMLVSRCCAAVLTGERLERLVVRDPNTFTWRIEHELSAGI